MIDPDKSKIQNEIDECSSKYIDQQNIGGKRLTKVLSIELNVLFNLLNQYLFNLFHLQIRH